ncbi:MAG: tetratricopeptide repeat protein [Leptolyngbya sp. LCM1.Bin17]|nr:MAG: tetratricopeptide repeat protein [Leptolyngbya sp. LCM1.Bin17]
MTSPIPPTPKPTLILVDEPTVQLPRDGSLLAQAETVASQCRQDQQAEAAQWSRQGLTYFRQGRYAQALASLQQALYAYRNLGDQPREARVLQLLGSLYYRLADYLWAADYGRQYLKVAQSLGHSQAVQHALEHLGNSYRHLGDLKQALEYMSQSLNLAKLTGDRQGEMRSLNNLAMVYRAKGLTRQAATLYEASLRLATTLQETTIRLQILQNLGNTYLALRDLKGAIDCYETFLHLSQAGAVGAIDNHTLRRILTNLTRASLAMADYDRAIVHLQHHLSLACSLGDTAAATALIDEIKWCYAALGEIRMTSLGLD